MGDCRLWLGGLDDDGGPPAGEGDWLAPEERARLDGLSAPLRRRQFLAGHWRVRVLAAAFAGGGPRDWRFGAEAGGRPWLDGPGGRRLHVSISHSGENLAVAVAWRAIGLDIEIPRRERDYGGLARHVFSPTEVQHIEALPPARRRQAFNTTWALKEAFGKRSGEGLQPAASRRVTSEAAAPGDAEAFSWALAGDGALALAAWPGADIEWAAPGATGRADGWIYRQAG